MLCSHFVIYICRNISFEDRARPNVFYAHNDVQDIVGMSYGVYLVVYILFTLFYFNLFPFIQWLKTNKPIAKWINNRKQTVNNAKEENSENTDTSVKNDDVKSEK